MAAVLGMLGGSKLDSAGTEQPRAAAQNVQGTAQPIAGPTSSTMDLTHGGPHPPQSGALLTRTNARYCQCYASAWLAVGNEESFTAWGYDSRDTE